MNFLQHFYSKSIKYDLVNKFLYKQSKDLPKLKKIILNIGCKNLELKKIAASLLALELITNQKSTLTKTKHSNILLKIRKGNPSGCKVVLRKKKMFNFLSKILIKTFYTQKNFNGLNLNINKNVKNKIFSCKIQNLLNFNELENNYYLFNNLSSLDITIVTNAKNSKEFILMIESLKFPLKNS